MRRLITLCAVVACASLAVAGTASAAPTWAPAATAPVHPGVQTLTNGGQCTSNFVFYDASDNVFIGQAAHCAGTDGNTATNGCEAGSLPVGTPVTVDGASQPGAMVYSSWVTMQANGEANADTCQYNDLAVVKLNPADYGKVNPSIPFWGGPTGLTDTVGQGAKVVYSYGNSSLRAGVEMLSPKIGTIVQDDSGGWSHTVYTVTPGIPGDSGSAFVDRDGRAFGVLSTLQIAPLPAGNGVGDLSRELAYMRSHGGPNLTLAQGTEPFRGPLLP